MQTLYRELFVDSVFCQKGALGMFCPGELISGTAKSIEMVQSGAHKESKTATEAEIGAY